jgi:thiamine-monophosphate kinase
VTRYDDQAPERRLSDVSEEDLLAIVLPLMRQGQAPVGELVGPGDDAAIVATPSGAVVVTTDSMVRGRDWRDAWCTGEDVGHKVVAQNLADLAAMGAVGTGLLVALAVDPQTPLAWVCGLATGIGAAAARWQVPVVGGDLSGAGAGVIVVSVTALGDLGGLPPVLRARARPGDVVALAGGLGRAAAGLLLLEAGQGERHPEAVRWQRRPVPPLAAGPQARALGATSMIDISDGLLRDADRVARASGVCIAVLRSALEADAAYLQPALGEGQAWQCVLGGGEEHTLLATFPAGVELPTPWRAVGLVSAGEGLLLDGEPVQVTGWDHFRP